MQQTLVTSEALLTQMQAQNDTNLGPARSVWLEEGGERLAQSPLTDLPAHASTLICHIIFFSAVNYLNIKRAESREKKTQLYALFVSLHPICIAYFL